MRRSARASRSGDRTWKCSFTPSRSAVMTSSAHRPTWSSEAATTYSPSPRYQASIPWSSQKRPIARTLSSPASQSAIAARSPNRCARYSMSPQNEFTKPPLRPLAPPPAMSCSRITTSIPGSSSVRCKRGPHPGVAAAEDHDVGGRVAPERRGGFAGIVGERLAEPPAPAGVGGDGHLHERLRSSLLGCSPASSQVVHEGTAHGRRARSSPQLGGHRRTPPRARSRDAPRRRLLRGRLRQAAGRRGVVVERGDAVQLPPRQARRAREGGRAPGRRRSRSSSARSPSPTGSRWATRG